MILDKDINTKGEKVVTLKIISNPNIHLIKEEKVLKFKL